MTEQTYRLFPTHNVPIKAYVNGVQLEQQALQQLRNLAELPFIHHHVAAMPDVHWGMGATIGSVIAANGAVIPAAVGVDIGCGMVAQRTNLTASDLPDDLGALRSAIEAAIPHGRTNDGGRGDRGAWEAPPRRVEQGLARLQPRLADIVKKHPKIERAADRASLHAGTLGGGNHFVEVCLDEEQRVWIMIHSGSRGIGNRIGTHFIELARKEMERHFIKLPDKDLAYLVEGSESFDDYVEAVHWAQEYAKLNRDLMMAAALDALSNTLKDRKVECDCGAVNCHHNYVQRERHFGADVLLTRKGAVSARTGELGIIPGSMGAKSFIVEGKGNRDSFCSCSHGAGRVMSRGEAKRRFTVEDHELATKGVECRKDAGVLDETPGAYKSIDAVMEAQRDLVSVVHTLKQVLCVKG
jgi:tRNA-splicing ligase RtcB